jgi:hypothetical protein
LFAVKSQAIKTTGVSLHVTAGSNQIRVLSEFTFYPLGTVLSWGEIQHDGLTPIRRWNEDFSFSSKQTAS